MNNHSPATHRESSPRQATSSSAPLTEAKPASGAPHTGQIAQIVRGEADANTPTPKIRVAAVIPGFGRAADIERLLQDLWRMNRKGIELWVVLCDNASPQPLADLVKPPEGLPFECFRNSHNAGGAGGFNAAMSRVLAGEGLSGQFPKPHFVWLLDSDARVGKNCLRPLVRVMLKNRKIVGAGSALTDQFTGIVYEIGGRISKNKGEWGPAHWGNHDRRSVLSVDYLAACSMLVRRDAIEKTGLMPDIFIHGDDVRWSIALTQATGGKLVGVPASRAYHPHFLGKFQTWTRYYGCRNGFPPIDMKKLGGWVRFRKALVETERAVCQTIMALDELGELHLQGIEDAIAGRTVGHHIAMGREKLIGLMRPEPMSKLAERLGQLRAEHGPSATTFIHPLLIANPNDLKDMRAQLTAAGLSVKLPKNWKGHDRYQLRYRDLVGAATRFMFGPNSDIAVVPTGWPTGWFRGKTLVEVTPDGFYVRKISRAERAKKAISVFVRGLKSAITLLNTVPPAPPLPPAPIRKDHSPSQSPAHTTTAAGMQSALT